jgi:hypothetical protein
VAKGERENQPTNHAKNTMIIALSLVPEVCAKEKDLEKYFEVMRAIT